MLISRLNTLFELLLSSVQCSLNILMSAATVLCGNFRVCVFIWFYTCMVLNVFIACLYFCGLLLPSTQSGNGQHLLGHLL